MLEREGSEQKASQRFSVNLACGYIGDMEDYI